MTAHVLVQAQRGGAPEDEGVLLARLAGAAEAALQRAREQCSSPGADDVAVERALRDARMAIDAGKNQALNLNAHAMAVMTWHTSCVRELERLARERLGSIPSGVGLEWTPLR